MCSFALLNKYQMSVEWAEKNTDIFYLKLSTFNIKILTFSLKIETFFPPNFNCIMTTFWLPGNYNFISKFLLFTSKIWILIPKFQLLKHFHSFYLKISTLNLISMTLSLITLTAQYQNFDFLSKNNDFLSQTLNFKHQNFDFYL